MTEFKYKISAYEKLNCFIGFFFTWLIFYISLHFSADKTDVTTFIKRFPDEQDYSLYMGMFTLGLHFLSLIKKYFFDSFINKTSKLLINEEGIKYGHPFFRFVNWELKWSEISTGWWSKDFFKSDIVLEYFDGKEKIIPIKSWRIDNETIPKNIIDYSFFQLINGYVDLRYLNAKQKKEYLREKHKSKIRQQAIQDQMELGKAAEYSSYIAVALTIVAMIASSIDYCWHTIGEGFSAQLFFIIASAPSILVSWYLFRKKTPLIVFSN